jgi:DNA-binding NtrC family response regulator
MPPLRERGHDIVEIATHFFERFSRQEERSFEQISEDAQDMLRNYDWPGNVRELENIVRNVVVMNQADIIGAELLHPLMKSDGKNYSEMHKLSPAASKRSASLDQLVEQIRPLSEVEREAIEHALGLCGGDVRKAAVFLDIAPATIYRKLKAWGAGRSS